jgi:putative ABC transport system permease protein
MRRLELAALALQGLRRSPLRVTLTTLGVTFATGMLATMIALSLGVQRQVETPFRALALLNNIEVRPLEHDGNKKPALLNDEALAEMEKLPGVAAAYPDAHVKNLHIRYDDKQTTAIGLAVPGEVALMGISHEVIIAGSMFSEQDSDRPQAIVGTGIVTALGFKSPQDAIGKEIAVEGAQLSSESDKLFTFSSDAVTVTIVGVYQPPAIMGARAQSGIFLPVELMKRFRGMYAESAWNLVEKLGDVKAVGYASATVRVGDPKDITRVEKEIRAMGFYTRSILSRLHDMQRFFLAIRILLTVVGTIALTIAALGIANTLLMAVLERYQEIGLCKAIGASDSDLFVLFLTEAGIIGLVGGLSGILLGWLLSCGMEALATVYAHRQEITGRLDLFAFPFWLLAALIAFAVVVSVVAGIYPALRAARVDPIRALRSH